MRFGVLGPLAVWAADGEPVPIPGAKVRALLARLLVEPGRAVSVGRLVDGLWGAALPEDPGNTLQGKVSQLRRALERAEPGGRELVVSGAGASGYLLRTGPGTVDAGRFTALLDRARAEAVPRTRAELLAEALGLWRGEAFADFAGEPFALAEANRLAEARLTALEEQADVRLELGEHAELAGELGGLVSAHPLRERLRAAHLRALYGAGRQTEALESFEELRRRLSDELGLEPGRELIALQQAVLRQDLTVAGAERPVRSAVVTNLPTPSPRSSAGRRPPPVYAPCWAPPGWSPSPAPAGSARPGWPWRSRGGPPRRTRTAPGSWNWPRSRPRRALGSIRTWSTRSRRRC